MYRWELFMSKTTESSGSSFTIFLVCDLGMKLNTLSTRVWQVTLMDYVHFWIN